MQRLARRAPTQISLIPRVPVLQSSFLAAGPKLLPWPCFHCLCSPFMLHCIICFAPCPARQCQSHGHCRCRRVCCRTVVGFPTQLDCRQQLQYGERCRSLSLACGAGAKCLCPNMRSPLQYSLPENEQINLVDQLQPQYCKEECAQIATKSLSGTLLESVRPGCLCYHTLQVFMAYLPSLSVLLCSHGRCSNGQMRCSSYSSVWKGSSLISKASVNSGDTQTTDELWELYFEDASQWWDNRVDKKNARSPDFKHKVTRKGLWIDGWSTPAWVKVRLKSVTQGRLQCDAGYGTRDLQDTVQGRRLLKGNNGKENAVSSSARELRQIAQGGGGRMHLQSARTTREAIAMLRNSLQQGMTIDSDMYVEVLKRCLKQKDGIEAKLVHDCIIKSGMDQNTYLGNNLLSVYIRCGRLQDARQVFDGLLKKNVISWTIMIGGYAQHSHAKDAIGLFHQMLQEGGQPNVITYLSILKGCASAGALEYVKEVHKHALEAGFESDVRVGSALLHMYAKCGSIEDAQLVFDRMEERDGIAWNVMIGAYANIGCADEAYRLFLQMKSEGFKPNAITYVSILNVCASTGTLEWVKKFHRHALETGFESDVRVCNALVHMYAKCGSIEDARLVFDRMEGRDGITWNVMIGAYANSGCGDEAHRLFLQMKRAGFKPDAITYVSILKACASALGALEWVKEVHRHALEAGFESDVRVCNALVHMYAKCGSIEDARLVFDRMEKHNGITWNVMIGAYANSGCGDEAHRLFLQMKRAGFKPDAITYVSILKACASAGALEWVKEVHRHALEAGFESDVRVCNALVNMYGKCGSIEDARLVFDRMEERDIVTWTGMIRAFGESGFGDEAYRLFLQMKSEGFKPDAITYVSILNACTHAGALEWVKEVHRHALEAGFELDVRVCNALVHMYAKSGSIEDARLVFDRMEERDGITWNVMIGAYAISGYGDEAYRLFVQMKWEGFEPDAITYVSILNACASAAALEWVKEVHMHALEAGFESDVRVCNALVHMYAKCSSIEDARLVFDRMVERDVVTWTVMIRAFGESGCGDKAYQLFLQMKSEGFTPDAITYVSILNACSSGGALEWVKEVHRHALEAGFESDVRVCNALVHIYAKCGSIEDARLVFDRMEERDVVTWTVMIDAYAEIGCGEKAYQLFLQMKREGFKPDAIMYVSILNACASAGALEWVKEVHRHALEAGFESDVRMCNALVHMYAKCGSIEDARLVFDRMEERDVVTWTIMIGGLAQHGCGHEALEFFRRMTGDGVKADGTSFVAVLSACSHAGLLDDGHRYFATMMQDYGIEPTVVHCNCMVDLLGRAGYLEEAKLFICNMPVEPSGATWGALLSACRTYGNVELGELAAKEILKLEPMNASTYVVLSNIYAAAGKWEEVSMVRSMMEERGIHKAPGRSWIEVDEKMHGFASGDSSHPEAEEIYTELNRLTERIKAEGYIPDTRLVLENIDEEDKERALCSHSEKLAIAYGLIHIDHGKPIRVYKNLRVCSDCHTATKFISKVTGREIVARDANRFHHFNDGVCSCGDYW